MGRLAQVFAAAFHPVRHPLHQLSGADPRQAEQFVRFRRAAQATRFQFGPPKKRSFPQQTAHRLGDFADTQNLRTGDVDDERGRRHLLESKQRHGVVIALPNDVEIAHRQVDGVAGDDFARQRDLSRVG